MREGEFVFGSVGVDMEFLRTELFAGMTRAKIAQSATDEHKRARNQGEARKAYDAVLHFLPQTSVSQGEKEMIDSKLAELKFMLRSLGEDCQ